MAARFDNSDGRLRGEKGKRRRLRLWRQNPHCAHCGNLTEYPKGFELDHIKALFQGGLDVDENLQVLCNGPFGCHAKKTQAETPGDMAVAYFPKWLEPVVCDLTIVFGPPGSGKTRYVSEHAAPFDRVIDVDQIIADLSGQPLYVGNREWLKRAIYLRNKMLSALSRETQHRAWFITTGTGKADRDWWVEKLKPTNVVLLNVPEATCIARIRADTRCPADLKQLHVQAASAWWQAEAGFAVRTGRKPRIGLDGWPEA